MVADRSGTSKSPHALCRLQMLSRVTPGRIMRSAVPSPAQACLFPLLIRKKTFIPPQSRRLRQRPGTCASLAAASACAFVAGPWFHLQLASPVPTWPRPDIWRIGRRSNGRAYVAYGPDGLSSHSNTHCRELPNPSICESLSSVGGQESNLHHMNPLSSAWTPAW
jgi:hypothetical protein